MCVYRPPSSSNAAFSNEIATLLDYVISKGKPVVTVGDFNINMIDKGYKNAGIFVNNLSALNLYPYIFAPTRVTSNTSTLIDNIFVSADVKVECSGIVIDDLTDHYPIFVKTLMCKSPINHCLLSKAKSDYVYKNRNYQTFRELLHYYEWNVLYNKLDEGYTQGIYNSDDLYNIFVNKYTALYNKAFN